MAINLPTDSAAAVDPAQLAAPTRPAAKPAPDRLVPQKPVERASQAPVAHSAEDTNVVFRRDANGQIYYVFTDSQSGRELQELPPKEVRNVGQGIADLVKELQQKSSNHIEVKG